MMTTQLHPKVKAYLERIGFSGEMNRSVETLRTLQRLHIHTVPYENLDIIDRIPISLEIDNIFDKIVTRKRGGYCFELNALFGWLLRELGYEVTDLFARFWRDEASPPPKRRHQVLVVEVEGEKWLCDVGVGGIVPQTPVLLVELLAQQQGDECYRLEKHSFYGWILQEQKRGEWQWLYSFTEEEQFAKDYLMASYWCEHSPDSIFTQITMVAIRTEDGRHTLHGDEFRIFAKDKVEVLVAESAEQYEQFLGQYFGIYRNL